jgi:type II secretory pathway component HofQ
VLRSVARACAVNMVMPASLQGPVTLNVTDVPCSQILEVILESNGLGYAYDQPTNFVRIGPRKQIEHELDEEHERRQVKSRLANYDDKLPAGETVDFDFSNAPTHDLAKVLADVGKVNVVIPDTIRASVTIVASKTPWDSTLKQVLAVNGLWLRYRPDGRIVRVAPRKELDHEDEEQLEKLSPR